MPKALMKKVPISEEEFLRKIEKMYGEYAIEIIYNLFSHLRFTPQFYYTKV